jgi:hypothetical protein
VSVPIPTTTISFPVGCSASGSAVSVPEASTAILLASAPGPRRRRPPVLLAGNRESDFTVFGPRTQRQDLDVEMNEVGREITGTLNRHAFT